MSSYKEIVERTNSPGAFAAWRREDGAPPNTYLMRNVQGAHDAINAIRQYIAAGDNKSALYALEQCYDLLDNISGELEG